MTQPSNREMLLELAERVAGFDCNITCPLCGETNFDIPGYLYSHRNGRFCAVEVACNSVLANNDGEVAAALRASSTLSTGDEK